MFALWMFGSQIEARWGARNFLIYYFVCMVVAALAQLAVVHFFTGGIYPTIGASGGVFVLLLAYGVMWPNNRLILISNWLSRYKKSANLLSWLSTRSTWCARIRCCR